MALIVEALDHLVINVTDVERSAAWYQRALGMTRDDFNPRQGKSPRTALKFWRQKIHLRPVSASKVEWFSAEHETAGSHDLCFLTRSQPQQVIDHLRACDIAIEIGPVEKRGALGTLDFRLLSGCGREPHRSLLIPGVMRANVLKI